LEVVLAVELAGEVTPREPPGERVRVRVVVAEGVAGAVAHARRTEAHLHTPALAVTVEDGDLLEVLGPLPVALEVEQDLEARVAAGLDCGALGDGVGHGPSILSDSVHVLVDRLRGLAAGPELAVASAPEAGEAEAEHGGQHGERLTGERVD